MNKSQLSFYYLLKVHVSPKAGVRMYIKRGYFFSEVNLYK